MAFVTLVSVVNINFIGVSMDNVGPTPRVNGKMLSQFIGTIVCICGRVSRFDQASRRVQVECSDKVMISVTLPPDETVSSSFVQIIGRADNSNTIASYRISSLGESFDLESYNQFIDLSAQYAYLFR